MTELFLNFVNMSISAGWIVLAVIILRLLLKKAPKWISVLLWGIVALRLICPFSIESALSLIPSTQTINPEFALNPVEIDSGVTIIDSVINPVIGNATVTVQPEKDVNLFHIIMPYLAGLWLVGIVVLSAYTAISYIRLKRKIGTAVLYKDNIFQSESVVSPFVLGIIKPKIYLPFNMNESDTEYVIAHENAHIKRKDHLWKPLGFLLLTIYWFNPLVWVGYILLCKDIELACDEKVVKEFDTEHRADYSQALLSCSISRRSVAACPLAFGEVGIKERIKGVMNYKKPAFWVIIAGVAVCIIAAVCLLTNPKGSEKTDYTPKISDTLDSTISLNIIENNQGKYLDGMMSFEAHKVLATKTSADKNDGEKITVYIVALYEEYSVENGELIEKGGSITPLALTYLVEEDISTGEDTYALTEYWEPGMGSEYVKDLEEKFPKGVNYDTQKYVEALDEDCIRQAIEYFGLDDSTLTEKNTQEYTTVMLEAKSDYELTVTLTKDEMISRIDNKEFFKKNGYHVYLYFTVSDTARITIGGNNLLIGEVLNSGKMSVDKLLQKAEEDAKFGRARMEMLKDGGTKIYEYDAYTIIKRNTTDGNKDLIISAGAINLGNDGGLFSYSECIANIASAQEKLDSDIGVSDEINGVTADISPDAQPQLTGKVTSATDKVIYMELNSDQGGIKKGTPVTVRLGSMLSYAPKIDTSTLKKGDIVTVIYDGSVMETYPLQIDAYAVYKK